MANTINVLIGSCYPNLSRSPRSWSYYTDLLRYHLHMIQTSLYLTDLHLMMSEDIESNPGPLDAGMLLLLCPAVLIIIFILIQKLQRFFLQLMILF